jgi:hypothetical protein
MAAAGAGSSNLADVFYADWIDSKSTAGATLWGPSGVAISSAPTRHLIYAATGNTYSDPPQVNSDAVLAFDMTTGRFAGLNRTRLMTRFCRLAGEAAILIARRGMALISTSGMRA